MPRHRSNRPWHGSGCDYALCYVDITVQSSTYELHLEHLKTVFGRLTAAGFTINAGKCNFCRTEICPLAPDRQRIKAVLSYPAPKNQRQLRQFLGVCNYHHRFIINYASYVAPLLHLIRKCNKWKWTRDLQKAFEVLRGKIAESVQLIHPDETLPYSIHTDASN